MPAYINIPSFPYSHSVTLPEFNGTPKEVWFRFVAPVGANALGWKTGTSATFLTTWLLETTTSNLVKFVNQSPSFWYLPLIAGDTYYVQVFAGGAIAAPFDVIADLAPVDPPIVEGSRIINDDHDGFAATIWSPSGTFVGFSTTTPAGETGDALSSGVSIWNANFAAAGSRIRVLAADLSLVANTDTSPTVGTEMPAFTHDIGKFWLVNRVVGNNGKVYSVSAAGVVSGLVATLPGAPVITAIGANSAGTVLYWTETASRAIHRHSLITDTALSDFYSVPAGPTIRLAIAAGITLISGINTGQINVLSDGSLVTWYRDFTNAKDVLIHVGANGSIAHTYDYVHPIQIDHISTHPDPESINVWFHLDATNVPGGALGRLAQLTLATGALTNSVDFDQFLEGTSKSLASTGVFGPSNSCSMVALGTSPPLITPPPDDESTGSCCDTPGGTGSTGGEPTQATQAWTPLCEGGGAVPIAGPPPAGEIWT